MNFLNNLIIAGAIAILTSQAMGSPDHDHGAPTFQPPKGGVLQSAHENHFELVKKDKTVLVYPYDKEGKPVETTKFKLKAKLEIPRKKTTDLELVDKTTHWEATIDAQKSHRFTLKINIDNGKEKDNVKFTVENK